MEEEIVGLVKRSRWRADPDPSDQTNWRRRAQKYRRPRRQRLRKTYSELQAKLAAANGAFMIVTPTAIGYAARDALRLVGAIGSRRLVPSPPALTPPSTGRMTPVTHLALAR